MSRETHPNAVRNDAIVHEANLSSTFRGQNYLEPPPSPLVSDLGAELLTLPLLLPAAEPSSALRSRNPVHSSARDSLLAGDSVKNSVDNDGVLGVR
jgi:hypothetical protein